MKNSRIKNGIMRIVQGIIIGAGAILPGISGGVLAVVFGIYRPAMELLTHPRRALQRYWRMLLAVGIGWALLGNVIANGAAEDSAGTIILAILAILAVIAAFLLIYSLIAGRFESRLINGPLLFLLVGGVLGDGGLGDVAFGDGKTGLDGGALGAGLLGDRGDAHPVQRQLPPCLGPVGVGEACAVFIGDVLLDDADALLVGGVHDVDGHVLGVCLAGGEGAALAVGRGCREATA